MVQQAPAVSTQLQPQTSLGLKLLFKRQSGDKYEVISGATGTSSPAVPQLNASISVPSSSLSSVTAAETQQSQRPKREASRRVKFRFSEMESDESPLKKKSKRVEASLVAYVPPRPVIRANSRDVTSLQSPRVMVTAEPTPTQSMNQRQLAATSTTPQPINRPTSAAPPPPPLPPPVVVETLVSFEASEIVERVDEDVKRSIMERPPRVIINHSIPFPIALVEDKTNVVYTKALLLIHLYKSHASPCIICVLCKRFFSIADFSRHFHISDEDLYDEEEDDDEEEEMMTNMNMTFFSADERRQHKLTKLLKNKYKILPYCLQNAGDLSEQQLKTWRMFSDRFNSFKKAKASALVAAAASAATSTGGDKKPKTPTTTPTPLSNGSKKLKSSLKESKQTTNWDRIDDSGDNSSKSTGQFILNRARLDDEKIVYLRKNGQAFANSRLSDCSDSEMEEEEEDECKATVQKERITHLPPVSGKQTQATKVTNEPDLSLSEGEEEDLRSNNSSSGLSDHSSTVAPPPLVAAVEKKLVDIRNNKYSYFYCKLPSTIEKHFNYYDNLTDDVLFFIESNHFLITPEAFMLYKLKAKCSQYKKFLYTSATVHSPSSPARATLASGHLMSGGIGDTTI
jgi:hypothetical protein